MAIRYIINQKSKRFHDRENLKEECNTDQIAKRAGPQILARTREDLIRLGFSPCAHCDRGEQSKV